MSVKGKKIILDAGHGGDFPGAVSGSRKEKTVTLKMAKLLKTKLEAKGATVYMTRTTDKDFGGNDLPDDANKRVKYINTLPRVDGFISIHCNSATAVTNVKGAFYQQGFTASKNFATSIASTWVPYVHSDNLAVLRDNTRTENKALLELDRISASWLDNATELDFQAGRIVAGIDKFY